MPAKAKLKDITIVVPGIMGSKLQKNGRDAWAATASGVWNALTSRAQSIYDLKLEGDDHTLADLGDGVQPTALFDDLVLVPRLVKLINGYSGLRRMIHQKFEIVGDFHNEQEATNYIEFPYDWRRDIRHASLRLKNMIDQRLHRWRTEMEVPDAKVILIGHSMGGLVSRHYLEVLEGWPNCKGLITLGTPHRGAVGPVDVLVEGYKIYGFNLGVNLANTIRSFTSMYQLLALYPSVQTSSGLKRVEEINLPHLPQARAQQGTRFLRDIASAVEKRQASGQKGYQMMPIVGTRQPTELWIDARDGKFEVKESQFATMDDPTLAHGDGRIPYASAIPLELSDEYSEDYFPVQHGAIQNDARVHDLIWKSIRLMQRPSIGRIRGGAVDAPQPALGLKLPDLARAAEPWPITIYGHQLPDGVQLTARIQGEAVPVQNITLVRHSDNQWQAQVTNLPEGYYSVTVLANKPDVAEINDVVAVAGV